jgi:hypothetical protein
MWRGASGSCSQRIALPSGARGSSAVGWPTQIVGAAGKHAALGLVRRFRHGVDAVGQVDQRHILQPRLFAIPAPVQRIVQLEIAAPVAEGFCAAACLRAGSHHAEAGCKAGPA